MDSWCGAYQHRQGLEASVNSPPVIKDLTTHTRYVWRFGHSKELTAATYIGEYVTVIN